MKKRIKKKIFKKKFDCPLRKFETDIQILKEMERVLMVTAILQTKGNPSGFQFK